MVFHRILTSSASRDHRNSEIAATVPAAQTHVRPVPAVDNPKIVQWIAALDDSRYKTRVSASQELAKLGHLAKPLLRKSLENQPSPEARNRISQLLEGLKEFQSNGERVRTLRAIEVLERMETPEARQFLALLAQGAAGTWQTKEAAAALKRLTAQAALLR